jgi:c(7)-type cytochrome triheme protein
VPDTNNATGLDAGTRTDGVKRRFTLLVATSLAVLCLSSVVVIGRRVFAVTTTRRSSAPIANPSSQDYSRFSHSSPSAHAALTNRSNCASCHRRSDSQPEPRFPLHKDCMGCHLVQFTTPINSSSINPICTICHDKDDLNSLSARTKKFAGLRSFTAEFDHAQHLRGFDTARPAQSCAACHAPVRRGVAQSIPAGLNAHQTCYQCHSTGMLAGNFSSCGSCHGAGSYSPTPVAARAYRVNFSHAEHGARQRLACASCHNVQGRGLPQGRQVSTIQPVQHFANPRAQSCITCHNGKRAFGDTDTRDCRRCHEGPGFRMRG